MKSKLDFYFLGGICVLFLLIDESYTSFSAAVAMAMWPQVKKRRRRERRRKVRWEGGIPLSPSLSYYSLAGGPPPCIKGEGKDV